MVAAAVAAAGDENWLGNEHRAVAGGSKGRPRCGGPQCCSTAQQQQLLSAGPSA